MIRQALNSLAEASLSNSLTMKTNFKFTFLLSCAAIVSMTTTAQETPMPELIGNVIYRQGWTQDKNEMGMYRLPSAAGGELEALSSSVKINATSGGVLAGDTYYACYYVDFFGSPLVFINGYNPETWQETYFNYGEIPLIGTAVAYDATDNKIYGCFRNDTNRGYVFGTVDYKNIKRNAICDLDRMWSAMGITRDGKIYAIDDLGILYIVDKNSGDMTQIGDTGLKASNPSSACIDPVQGRFFYALTSGTKGSLYEVNLSTAESTLIYDFADNAEIVGLFSPMPATDANAPASVTDLTFDFPEGSLQGSVSFTAPATTFSGTTLTGDLYYEVYNGDTELAYGKCSAGESLNITLTLPSAGYYDFSVFVRNSAGNGQPTDLRLYMGKDTPGVPVLTESLQNGVLTLSWKPVTESVHGGYIDTANIVYDVLRLPDDKRILTGSNETSVSDPISTEGDLRFYYYAVTARYSDISSEQAISSTYYAGAATPPYEVVFDSPENARAFTTADGNADGKTWYWSNSDKAFVNSFNRAADCNDWLISPALRLKKGEIYRFATMMRSYNGNPENMEIRWGTDPADLNNVLVSPTEVKTRDAREFGGYINVMEDGIYYVGIRHITKAEDAWFLYVDAIKVSAGVGNDVPSHVDDLSVIPDPEGAKTATISFSSPSQSVNGNTLNELSKIEILRDGVTVKTFDAPTPGETLSFTDAVPKSGYYIYQVIPYNPAGPGRLSELRVYIGVNIPGKPAWARVEETSTPGEVHITWAPVDKAEDGSPMNPKLITYTIVTVDDTHGGEAYNVAENLTETEYTFQAVPEGKQQFVYYAIKAITETGYSFNALTPFVPVGKAYTLPYKESFTGSHAASIIRTENADAVWSLYSDESGITSQDRDAGMAGMFGENPGASADIYSGKVSLNGAKNPALTLYAYNIAGETPDTNELVISIGVGDNFTEVRRVVMKDLNEADGWYPIIVPLTDYIGKEIQFMLRGITGNRKFTLVDNISISEIAGANLHAGLLTVPSTIRPGEEFTIRAGIDNIGGSEASDYTVILFNNGKEIASQKPASIPNGHTQVIDFHITLPAVARETNEFTFYIDWNEDTDLSDNTSASSIATMVFPTYPVPRNLRGNATKSGTTIEWDRPAVGNVGETITESFEDWTSWSKSGLDGWTFVDVDNAGIGTIQGVDLPGIEYDSKLSWFVFDADGFTSAFSANTGNKYLSTMFCLPPGDFTFFPNDDWAISPLLCGEVQEISLYARSINVAEAEESFEILYSTKDSTDPADFISVVKIADVPGDWTLYDFTIPKGALRFAIRYDKTYGLMLHVDDVTFTPAGDKTLELEGYNIYREGEKLATLHAETTSYSDTFVCSADTEYCVTALYKERGESRGSDRLIINVNQNTVNRITDNIKMSVINDTLVIENPAGLRGRICDATGRLIATVSGAPHEEFRLGSGIYLISVSSTTRKIIVK